MKRTDKKQPQRLPPRKQRKLKKIKKEAAAQEEGRILGQYKAHSKKPLLESIKEHLGRMVDNVHIDPVEIAAIMGTAILVKRAIDETPVLAQKIQDHLEKYPLTPLFGLIGGLLFAVAPVGAAPLKPGEIDKH